MSPRLPGRGAFTLFTQRRNLTDKEGDRSETARSLPAKAAASSPAQQLVLLKVMETVCRLQAARSRWRPSASGFKGLRANT